VSTYPIQPLKHLKAETEFSTCGTKPLTESRRKGLVTDTNAAPMKYSRRLARKEIFVGHGTIVASIAAGGVGGGWRLRGVAPGAELIVVKSGGPACGGSRWFFDEKGLIDGISYAVEKARSLGRRLVVVLSLGTNLGGHDGGEPLERMLEAWAEEGVVFAVAAGNSGDEARHATGFLAPGQRNNPIMEDSGGDKAGRTLSHYSTHNGGESQTYHAGKQNCEDSV
jgi:subtilisin family serine protease